DGSNVGWFLRNPLEPFVLAVTTDKRPEGSPCCVPVSQARTAARADASRGALARSWHASYDRNSCHKSLAASAARLIRERHEPSGVSRRLAQRTGFLEDLGVPEQRLGDELIDLVRRLMNPPAETSEAGDDALEHLFRNWSGGGYRPELNETDCLGIVVTKFTASVVGFLRGSYYPKFAFTARTHFGSAVNCAPSRVPCRTGSV